MNRTKNNLRRMSLLALLSMTVALPATSMNSRSINSGDTPAPSTGQWALIEAHDTASVGWWSSPAMDIAPWPDVMQPSATPESGAAPDPLAPAPESAYPRRLPGVESR